MFSGKENVSFGVLCLLAGCISTSSCLIHLQAKNIGVLLMMFWCFTGLVNKGINALAFNNSLRLAWTLGCDLSAIIERTWQFGLCCSALCVLQRLEGIASLRQAHSTVWDRKRRLLIDFGVGLGLPALQIPMFLSCSRTDSTLSKISGALLHCMPLCRHCSFIIFGGFWSLLFAQFTQFSSLDGLC